MINRTENFRGGCLSSEVGISNQRWGSGDPPGPPPQFNHCFDPSSAVICVAPTRGSSADLGLTLNRRLTSDQILISVQLNECRDITESNTNYC